MRALCLLLLTLLVACASEPRELTQLSFGQTTQETTTETDEPTCEVVFTPDAEILAETQDAAARWSAATGCDIRVGEGGIVVRVVADRMLTPQGTEAHGHTYCPTEGCTRSGLVIDIARDHAPATIAHEMGHALASSTAHVEDDTQALMFHTGGDGAILSPDLVLVCTTLDCSVMTTEA